MRSSFGPAPGFHADTPPGHEGSKAVNTAPRPGFPDTHSNRTINVPSVTPQTALLRNIAVLQGDVPD